MGDTTTMSVHGRGPRLFLFVSMGHQSDGMGATTPLGIHPTETVVRPPPAAAVVGSGSSLISLRRTTISLGAREPTLLIK